MYNTSSYKSITRCFMNILIVNWRDLKNPLYGGAEIHIEKIASYLAKKHKVYFLCTGFNSAASEEEYNGVSYIRMGSELTFNFTVYMNIRKVINRYSIDVILEDINKVPFYTPLFTEKPVLAVIPHIFGRTIFSQANPVAASYVYLSEKPLKYVYRNNFFEVISQSTKEDLIRRGIKKEMIEVIECGIEPEQFRKEGAVRDKSPLIVYVGRLKKYKSVQHALLAFDKFADKFPESKMMIVGTGDYSEELKQIAGGLRHSGSIEFTGYVSEDEKVSILNRAWISVYPSLIEGWGIVNIEANASGTPVICSNVPGLRDSVKDGYSGFLYEYGNIGEMAEKMELIAGMMKNDDRMVRNAMEWARGFSWDRTGRLTEEWINTMLSSRSIDNE